MKRIAAASFTLILFAPSAYADTSAKIAVADLWEMPLEQLMLVPVSRLASGTPTPVSRAASSVTVISRADIEAIGANDLDQLLETVPGLHVGRSDQSYFPKYNFRGITSTHNGEALLLINGIAVKSQFTGSRSQVWAGMPVKAIERIEVIRGPGSALYGADAFAGVINVITKTGSDIARNRAGVRAGSFDTWGAWIEQRLDFNSTVVGLVAEFEDTNGQRETVQADAQTLFDGLLGTQASLAPGPVNLGRQAADLRLDLQQDHWQYRLGYQFRDHIGSATGIAQALDPWGLYRSSRINTDLTFNQQGWKPHWDLQAQLSYYRTTQESQRDVHLFPPGANLGNGEFADGMIGNPSYKEDQARLDLSTAFHGFAQHIVRLGSGYFWGDIYEVTEEKNFDASFTPLPAGLTDVSDTADAFLREEQRKTWYLYAQDEWRASSSVALTTGIRYDHFEEFGGTLNPRAALVKEWQPNVSTRLGYGRAFHAPSFVDLYATSNPVRLGNPDLDPETIDTWELSFHHQPLDTLSYSLTGFSYRISDIIVPGPSRAENGGRRKGRGGELEATWQAQPALRLTGHYSYQVAVDAETGIPAGEAPTDKAYLRLDWQFVAGWQWGTELLWVGKQPRAAGDARLPLQDYTTLNLTLAGRNVWQQLDLMLSLRNLFDANMREPSPGPSAPLPVAFVPDDYPLAGRSVLAEASWHW